MTALYFFICALESALLAVYSYRTGSTAAEQVFLGLSPARLLLVCALAFLAALFLGAAFLSLKKQSRFLARVRAGMQNERVCWRLLCASLFLAGGILFIFTRSPQAFGDWRAVYTQFQPVLSLIFLLSFQSAGVLLVQIGFHHANIDSPDDKEIRFVWLAFGLLALHKFLYTSAGAYGPVNGDEMEYFSLAYYLSQGNIFQAVDPIHYPPLYPLLLTTTLPFGLYTFDLIKALNILLSSSIVFPIYLIARRYLTARQSLLVVLGAGLLPFHLVFPRRIQSENLYFPLLYWAMSFILADPRNPRRIIDWDFLSGALLGLLYLTRYISLAVLPVFLLGWGLKVARSESGRVVLPRRFMALAVSGLAIYTPWMAAGLSQGYTFKDMLGLFITASVENPQQLSFGNLMLWVLIYAAYLVLMAAPVLPFLLVVVRDFFSGQLPQASRQWIVFSAALTAVYSAAVVRHSWRANYNAELPVKIMGRYLIFLAPVFLIAALLALREQSRREHPSVGREILLRLVIPSALVSAAYLLLIRKSILPISAAALNALGAVDGYMVSLLGVYFFIILIPLYCLYLWLHLRGNTRLRLVFIALGLGLFYLAAQPAYKAELQEEQNFTRVGRQTAVLLSELDSEPYGADIRLLLPNELTSIQKQQIYMTVQISGYPLLTPASYNSARQLSAIIEDNTVLIWDGQAEWTSSRQPQQVYRLAETPYLLFIF